MKIAFLTKRHFLKTKSDQFLIDLLATWAEVAVFRREEYSSWQLYKAVRRARPDILLFFATPPSLFHHLLRFPFIPKIFVPMYDGFKPFKPFKEMVFRLMKLRALSFSLPVHEYLTQIGLSSLRVHYFPELRERPFRERTPPYTFFFWQRHKGVGLQEVRALIGEENIAKIFYKAEPGVSEEGSKLVYLPEWLSEADLEKITTEVDVVIAPRRQEGIGMAYLKALALGVPVLGFADHTMAEYIKPGENGWFFNNSPPPAAYSSHLSIKPLGNFASLNAFYAQRWAADRERIRTFFFSKKRVH